MKEENTQAGYGIGVADKPSTPMAQVMEAHESLLQELEAAVSELGAKLSPIRNQSPTTAENQAEPAIPSNSEIVNQLSRNGLRTRAVIDKVKQYIHEIEL
jgi:hypothetical protein